MIFCIDNKFDAQFLTSKTLIEPSPIIFIFFSICNHHILIVIIFVKIKQSIFIFYHMIGCTESRVHPLFFEEFSKF
jgi:hypothetical protein